jgi:hypothetical protein
MKRFIAAAALAAAAVVPATQAGAVPIGSQNACAIANSPATPSSACRVIGSSSGVGVGGFAGPGGAITLTHKEKTSSCDNHVIVHTTTTKTDKSVTGPNYLGSQGGLSNGVVYTLTVSGPGFAAAGGQGTPGPNSASEPADAAQDLTGGTVAGAVC